MEKPCYVADENAHSIRLKEQIDAIKGSINSADVTSQFDSVSKITKESVEVETDISLSCSRSDDPLVSIERADEEFWRLVTESFSEKVDEMRRENLKVVSSLFIVYFKSLEEEIRSMESKKAKLEEARDELIAVVESAISGEGPT
uniref:TACC_C domain-containing protein n=1 Tax=Ascaris lumbricoides TaxID=6252 RepID=A0A0M3I6D1_ASCLU